jgi:hypothetical protein
MPSSCEKTCVITIGFKQKSFKHVKRMGYNFADWGGGSQMKGLGPPRPNLKNLIAYKAVSYPFLIHGYGSRKQVHEEIITYSSRKCHNYTMQYRTSTILTTISILSILPTWNNTKHTENIHETVEKPV